MNDQSKLRVWQKSLELADKVYSATDRFPSREVFGLASQMQRAAVSIGSNLSEGAGRNSGKEFYQFIGYANGSANELRFQVEVGLRRNYLSEEERNSLVNEIDHILRMNDKLQSNLRDLIERSKKDLTSNSRNT
ncbi:MAG: four helix bundle protein [Bacteroidia bacterium]